MANGYSVDYNDKRFAQVESQKNAAIKESDKTYDNMINQSDSFFQSQIDAVNQYGETQKQNQQAETDFTIEKIEQEKDQAHKDYLKEQSASYVDWQKQSNQYGANAEQMAAGGLSNTGYSESSQVSMYNTYQNRVVAAREAYNKAVLNYNNAITEARLQNNSLLAEIAADTLEKSLKLALEGFQYKNELLDKKATAKRDIDKDYYSRYQDVVSQINTENSLAETIRSNKAQEAHNKATLEENKRQYNQSYQLKVKEFNEQIRQFNEEIARLKAQDAADNKYKIQQLEIQKAQLEEEKRQYDKSYELQKKNLNNSGGGGGGGSGGGGDSSTTGQNPKPQSPSPTPSTNTKNTVSNQAKLDLGKGPISDNKVKQLVESKEVIAVEVDGKDTLQWNKPKLPLPTIATSTSISNFISNLTKKK